MPRWRPYWPQLPRPIVSDPIKSIFIGLMGLRLGIDIDGVLADFRTAFRDTARECLRREVLVDAGEKASVDPVDIERVWECAPTSRPKSPSSTR
jgi:hypothetical protein